ncbi:MAG: acetate/propionate family kinase [Candidatus Pacebacteria bacterium]|nr:acetate/propionate family kinase [Candidatus Paceibacterota bacterium]
MIFSLNCGSQSIKYRLFDADLKSVKEKKIAVKNSKDYQKIFLKELKELEGYKKEIKKVCHRVVHGGEEFRKPLKITESNLRKLEKYNELAPLHNPFNILGIKLSRKIFPRALQVAVFDTGFFENIPPKAFIYGLPENLKKKYNFRRFGFHGISHEYASREGAEIIGNDFEKLKIISCHLGGGSSIAAIKGGKAIDTSMGFTPSEGLLMMTRCGDVDPGILIKLSSLFSSKRLDEILNKDSGIKGICGISEMKEVLSAIKKGDKKAELALEIFVYRIQKYIGSYFAILGGCDLLVFTGAIGEGSEKIRKMITGDLNILKETKIISVKTDEELHIVRKSRNFK